jgi:hypothetical protein
MDASGTPTLAVSLLTSAAMAGCDMQNLQQVPAASNIGTNDQVLQGQAAVRAPSSTHPRQMLCALFPNISGLNAGTSSSSGSGQRKGGRTEPALPTASGISFLDSSQQPGSATRLPWATDCRGMNDSLLSFSPGRKGGYHQHNRVSHDEFCGRAEGTPGAGA